MDVGAKFDYDKYLKGPEDYWNYCYADPVLGHILLDVKNKPIPKEHPLATQTANSISPSDLWNSRLTRSKPHTEAGNITDPNTANSTLLDPCKAQNSQAITTQPVSPISNDRIDNNPQIPVTHMASNSSTDPHNVSIDSEIRFGINALAEKIYNETVDDILAGPKINPSFKEGISSTVISILSTFKNVASPLLNRIPVNPNGVETVLNATDNGINNSEQLETSINEEINKYQAQIDQLKATNEQEKLKRLGMIT